MAYHLRYSLRALSGFLVGIGCGPRRAIRSHCAAFRSAGRALGLASIRRQSATPNPRCRKVSTYLSTANGRPRGLPDSPCLNRVERPMVFPLVKWPRLSRPCRFSWIGISSLLPKLYRVHHCENSRFQHQWQTGPCLDQLSQVNVFAVRLCFAGTSSGTSGRFGVSNSAISQWLRRCHR